MQLFWFPLNQIKCLTFTLFAYVPIYCLLISWRIRSLYGFKCWIFTTEMCFLLSDINAKNVHFIYFCVDAMLLFCVRWILTIPRNDMTMFNLIRSQMKILLKSHIWASSWIKYHPKYTVRIHVYKLCISFHLISLWHFLHFHYFKWYRTHTTHMHSLQRFLAAVHTNWKYLHEFLNTVS